MEFDFSEVDELIADLGAAEGKMAMNVAKAVEVTARHVKDGWQEKAARTGLTDYASTVDYDVEHHERGVEAEIGPNLSRRPAHAPFGLVERGGSGVFSAPQHAGRDALEDAKTDFVQGILKAGTDALS
ncbi:hypothetical protein [Microbacterium sp. YY-01]|uniref:hypothetical protein n=1 Tax=Microbacterium sp. YY-01 TaxID=3421634 RepID=UPI003D17024B